MTTAEDVGRKAGVSVATVSRVFSQKGYVSRQTREAVLSAAEELGYFPNAIARGLKTQRSGFIAFIMPEVLDPYFFATLARGVEEVAAEHGFNLLIGNTNENPSREQSLVELMVANAVEGVIITPAGGSARSFKSLASRKIPTVFVDRTVPGFSADSVCSDDRKGAALLVEHLAQLGHKRIALINGHMNTSVARDRAAGFREAMERLGLDYQDQLVSSGLWTIESAESRMTSLLGSRENFTAVVGANLYMSIGVLRSLRQLGRSVPGDLSLVSFNDLELAAEIDPFLTVLSHPIQTMGRVAMNLLTERINGRYQGTPRALLLSPQLIVRQSTGAVP